MSLTSLLKKRDSELSARFKAFRPGHRPDSKRPLLVPPRSKRYSMVGTAFDYLLRFELERCSSSVIAGQWVAELAPDLIFKRANGTQISGLGLSIHDPSDPLFCQLPGIATRATAVITAAKKSVRTYCGQREPSDKLRREVAEHAVRLARLDPIVRAGYLDKDFVIAPDEDVNDLLDMLEVTPFDRLLEQNPIILNPNFGKSSMALGGADADFIAGDLLIDIKVKSKSGGLPTVLFDQLLGYVLLCRAERLANPKLPDIRRAGLLFPRQGYLWTVNVDEWEALPGFEAFETWFRDFLNSELQSREDHRMQLRFQQKTSKAGLHARTKRVTSQSAKPRKKRKRLSRKGRRLRILLKLLLMTSVLGLLSKIWLH